VRSAGRASAVGDGDGDADAVVDAGDERYGGGNRHDDPDSDLLVIGDGYADDASEPHAHLVSVSDHDADANQLAHGYPYAFDHAESDALLHTDRKPIADEYTDGESNPDGNGEPLRDTRHHLHDGRHGAVTVQR